jgi:hypothetical protein
MYIEKEDSIISVEIVVYTCIPEWIYNKIDASCFKDYVSLAMEGKETKETPRLRSDVLQRWDEFGFLPS